MLSDYAPSAVILFLIKTVDIAAKILIIEQVFTKKELTLEMSIVLLTPLHKFLPYMGLLIYPPLIMLAF